MQEQLTEQDFMDLGFNWLNLKDRTELVYYTEPLYNTALIVFNIGSTIESVCLCTMKQINDNRTTDNIVFINYAEEHGYITKDRLKKLIEALKHNK